MSYIFCEKNIFPPLCLKQFTIPPPPLLSLKLTNFPLYVWKNQQITQICYHCSQIQWNLFKKLLVVQQKEEKKLQIALLFSWIAFLPTVIPSDLIEKSNIIGIFALFPIVENDKIINYSKHRGGEVLFPLFFFNSRIDSSICKNNNNNCLLITSIMTKFYIQEKKEENIIFC